MDCIVFQHSFFLKPSKTSLNLTHQLGSTSRIRAWKLVTCCGNRNVNGSLPPFGTLETEITNEIIDFFVSDAEGDPDRPSPGYSPIEQAITALRQQKFVVVVDEDEIGNVEGSLVMGACHASEKRIGFMVRHGSGIVSVGMKGEDLERLKLPLMSPENEDDSSAPSFTITVMAHVTLLSLFDQLSIRMLKLGHQPVYRLRIEQTLYLLWHPQNQDHPKISRGQAMFSL